MSNKIDNSKAIENISKYITEEAMPNEVVEALDDAYYMLSQYMAQAIDNDSTETIFAARGSVHGTMYHLHRLKEILLS